MRRVLGGAHAPLRPSRMREGTLEDGTVAQRAAAKRSATLGQLTTFHQASM
jgi:hypothetical protein